MSLLFQCFLYEGILPDIRKVACIVPIYKGKGSRDDVISKRHISLTSVICKLMESLIKQNVTLHCLKNNLISPAQHGFVPGKSTVTIC